MNSLKPIIWQTEAYVHYERSDDWYWIVGIVGLTVSALFFVFANWTMGIIVFLCIGLLLWHIKQLPPLVDCEISAQGIRVNQKIISLKKIEKYNIDRYADSHRLIIITTDRLGVQQVIPLGAVLPDEVHDFFSFYNIDRDEDLHEPFFAVLLEYLGF